MSVDTAIAIGLLIAIAMITAASTLRDRQDRK